MTKKKIIHTKTQRPFTSAMQIPYLHILLFSLLSIFTDTHKNSISDMERGWPSPPLPKEEKNYFVTVKNIF